MAKISSGNYVEHPQSVCGPDGSHPNWMVNTVYDNAEFTVANGTTDYDVSANEAKAFNNVPLARYVSIRTDVTITVKFNATTNDSITITSSDSPLTLDVLEVSNIYISNASGSTANIKILLLG